MSDISERLTKVETIVERHEELLKNQISKNEDIAVLRNLMERQDERDEKQNQTMDKITETLQGMNENLSNLNFTQEQMKDDLSAVSYTHLTLPTMAVV